ncbi:MAG: L,D-transpeptidase family protein [Stellaceae bacterium]
MDRLVTHHRAALGRSAKRRAAIIGTLLLALSAPGAMADPPASAPVMPAASPLPEPGGGPATLSPFTGNDEVEDRLDPASRLMLAGERLDDHLLRRFYLAHHYQMVWNHYPRQATVLWDLVRHATRQGLDPALFHSIALTRHWARLSPVERDLLLSDAFLSYAEALAGGAVPVADRDDNEALRAPSVDIVAALDAALAAPDPAARIEALAPSSPEYEALCRAYLAAHAIAAREPGSGPGRQRPTPARIAAAQWQVRQLAVNLERLRWLPRSMPGDRVVVDTAVAQLRMFRDDRPIFTTRVVIGEFDKQTPEFQSVISGILFNPPWNVPRSIFEKEIRPKLAANRHYLAEHHMRWRGAGEVQQAAGPYSSLGRLKFEMADRFDVYLHDTPEKWRFAAAERLMSHGCVRVENPNVLAAMLLGESPQAIAAAIAVERTHGRKLPQPMPVFLVYRTAVAESDGTIAFRGDPYERDARIWAYLDRVQQPSISHEVIASQR